MRDPLPPYQPDGAESFERPDVRAGDRPSGASFASRSSALGCSGAAATVHPIATLTAIETLKRGGSAVDAAIAANACLGFLEPTSCGIGGDCYAMLWDPAAAKVVGMAGSGRSPKSLDLETVRAVRRWRHRAVWGDFGLDAGRGRMRGGPCTSVTAGCVGRCFKRAIISVSAARRCAQLIAFNLKRNLALFQAPDCAVEETSNAMRTYAPSGRAPREGEMFRNPDLARTYRLIAEGGRDAFYEGSIAPNHRRLLQAHRRLAVARGSARRSSEWIEPLVSFLSRAWRFTRWVPTRRVSPPCRC